MLRDKVPTIAWSIKILPNTNSHLGFSKDLILFKILELSSGGTDTGEELMKS